MTESKRTPVDGSSDIARGVSDFELTRYRREMWAGTFQQFLDEKLLADPYRYTRTAYQMAVDMLDHYGAEEFEDSGETLHRYRLFDDPFTAGKGRIFGLDRTIGRLVKYIRAAAREEGKERIFVLHGPVGTAKTSLLDLLSRGLEEYTHLPEGEVLTFSWAFPANFDQLGSAMGFSARQKEFSLDDVAVTLPCQMRDNPLLIIPREPRQRLLRELFETRYGRGPGYRIVPRKVLDGDLCYNCKQVYNYLHRRFEGDWRTIARFVRVERFTISSTLGVGVCKVLPEGNVEAAVSPVSLDENYRFAVNLMNSLNLVRFGGPYVRANRGIIHYSDIYKKPVVYLQHLLAAVEEHKISWGEITGDIDVMIVGTTNPPEYVALRKNPISLALRSRCRKIDVPYLLNYREEMNIYESGLEEAQKRIHVLPHCTELAALFAVMTRLERSELHRCSELEPDARRMLEDLAPLAKAELFGGVRPEGMSLDDRQLLTRDVRRRLRNEFPYEGMDGVPTRILQNLFADLCEADDERAVHPFELFAGFERIISQGAVNYDFLAREEEDGYHDFSAFVDTLRARYDRILIHEIQDAVVDVDHADLDRRIRDYLAHVTAFNKKEKILDPVTGGRVDPDEQKMRAIEDPLDIDDDDRESWRFQVISRASQFARKDTPLDVREVYEDIFTSVFMGIYNQKRAGINWNAIQSVLEKSDEPERLAKEPGATARDAERIVAALINRHGYDYQSARRNLLYFINKKAES